MTDSPASKSIDDAPAVVAVQRWLRRGALAEERPSAEVIQDLLGIAVAAFDGRDELVEQRDEMRRLGREAEMERDTVLQAQALLREDIERLTRERDEARKAAAHLWYGGEHGIDQTEVCEWYPWVVPLLDEHAREWTEKRLDSRRELREQRDEARAAAVSLLQAARDHARLIGDPNSLHPWLREGAGDPPDDLPYYPEKLRALRAERDDARAVARQAWRDLDRYAPALRRAVQPEHKHPWLDVDGTVTERPLGEEGSQ